MGKIHNTHTVTYRKITESEVSTASLLHEQVLESTGSRIGQAYLQALYNELLSKPKEHMVLGAFHRKTLVGLVSASRRVDATDSIIYTHLFELLPRIIVSGFKGHISPVEIMSRRSLHAYTKTRMKPDDIYIHALFIDPEYRRCGIASTLVRKVQHAMHAHRIYVDTQKTNSTAIQSYAYMGFERVREIGHTILLRSCVCGHYGI